MCSVEEFDQCPHVKLKANQLFTHNLVAASMAEPVESINFMALIKQVWNNLTVALNTIVVNIVIPMLAGIKTRDWIG